MFRRVGAGRTIIVNFERDTASRWRKERHTTCSTTRPKRPEAPVQYKSEITRHELMFDRSGFTAEVHYEDNWGTPQHDAQDSFGERYAYSPEGLSCAARRAGPTGAEITLKNGVYAVTLSYDAGKAGSCNARCLAKTIGRSTAPDGYAYFIRRLSPIRLRRRYRSADLLQRGRKADIEPGGIRRFSIAASTMRTATHTEVAFAGTDGKLIALKKGYAIEKRKIRRSWPRHCRGIFRHQPSTPHIARSGLPAILSHTISTITSSKWQ